ncbi:hypothetical protein [Hymenobacter guriensis]|uniref:Uncharacterized protein n=1 Tax=Hymenobacter guriensis TaxID=2793065 RepID=A0ABS0KWV3_9BACT|nr:hypothetical protein [Hymenobacter guriensis]MBG8552337.1 hypothetical protein [Hymenobacter guriensis]
MSQRDKESASPAAQRAAERHEDQTGHLTEDLWDDNMEAVEGKCCHHCDWMRYNVQPVTKTGWMREAARKARKDLRRKIAAMSDAAFLDWHNRLPALNPNA